MKTKLLLAAALIGAVSLSAHAGVYVGASFGGPAPRVVVAASAPCVPAPVVVAPVVTTVPAGPGPGYVWVPGYWSGNGVTRAWVAGCWRPPVHVVYGHRNNGRGDHGDHRYGGRR